MNNTSIPNWKIKGLNNALGFLEFESFDMFPSNRRAGIYCSALLRQGLIRATEPTWTGNWKYELTLKGLKFIKEINSKGEPTT